MDYSGSVHDDYLRLYFASQALTGILAGVNLTVKDIDPKMAEQIAANAYAVADAMIERKNRDKPAEQPGKRVI